MVRITMMGQKGVIGSPSSEAALPKTLILGKATSHIRLMQLTRTIAVRNQDTWVGANLRIFNVRRPTLASSAFRPICVSPGCDSVNAG